MIGKVEEIAFWLEKCECILAQPPCDRDISMRDGTNKKIGPYMLVRTDWSDAPAASQGQEALLLTFG
jgi:hypothetical protein